MDCSSVELDDQSSLRPKAIGIEVAALHEDVGVESRPRQSIGVEQSDEALLQFLLGGDALQCGLVVENRAQHCCPPPSRISLEQIRDREPIRQSEHFSLVQRPFEPSLRQHGRQIENRSRDRCHRDPIDDGPLIFG
jgi:hypothetical protein